MSTAPTILIGIANAASTIPGSVHTAWVGNGAAPYRGAGADIITGINFPASLFKIVRPVSDGGSASSGWRVTFVTDADAFEIVTLGKGAKFRIFANSEPATADPTAGPAADGNGYLVKVTYASAAVREITIIADSLFYFDGVRVGAAYTVTAPITAAPSERIVVIGDSFCDGTGADAQFMCWPYRLAELYGWEDIWVTAQGGTGYLATNAPFVKFRDRVAADVIAFAPDIVVVAGGINDTAFTPAQLGAEAALLYADIVAGLPAVTLYVVGLFWPRTPSAAELALDAALQTAAVAAGATFLDPLAEPWIGGTGFEGSPQGDGNADIYTGTDSTHPTQGGHDYLGSRVFRALTNPNPDPPEVVGGVPPEFR